MPEDYVIINDDLRTMQIPSTIVLLGVESDDDVNKIQFKMPKEYCGFDLSTFSARINYMNAKGEGDVYVVDDLAVDGDDPSQMTFTWLVGRNACKYKGSTRFIVCLKLFDTTDTDVVVKEFNTTVYSLPVLEGLETTEAVVQDYPDIIQYLINLVEQSGAIDPNNYYTKAETDALIPTKLPNPEKLTINGNQYDGSEPVDLTIEASSEVLKTAEGKIIHINDAVADEAVESLTLYDDEDTQLASGDVAIANKNLFRIDLLASQVVSKGITFTKNADGSISCSGTSTGTYPMTSCELDKNMFAIGMTYCLSSGKTSGFTYVQLIINYTDNTTDYIVARNSARSFTISKEVSSVTGSVQLTDSGVTISNEVVYPQLEIGSSASAFVNNSYSEITYDGTVMPVLPASICNVWANDDVVANMVMEYEADTVLGKVDDYATVNLLPVSAEDETIAASHDGARTVALFKISTKDASQVVTEADKAVRDQNDNVIDLTYETKKKTAELIENAVSPYYGNAHNNFVLLIGYGINSIYGSVGEQANRLASGENFKSESLGNLTIKAKAGYSFSIEVYSGSIMNSRYFIGEWDGTQIVSKPVETRVWLKEFKVSDYSATFASKYIALCVRRDDNANVSISDLHGVDIEFPVVKDGLNQFINDDLSFTTGLGVSSETGVIASQNNRMVSELVLADELVCPIVASAGYSFAVILYKSLIVQDSSTYLGEWDGTQIVSPPVSSRNWLTSFNALDNIDLFKGKAVLICGRRNDNSTSLDASKIYFNNFKRNRTVNEIPSYWNENISTVKNSVITNRLVIGNNLSEFIFITDTHWSANAKKSPLIIAKLMEELSIDRIIFGGDAVDYYYPTALECATELQDFFGSIKTDKILSTFGNHDDNTTGNTLSKSQLYPFFSKRVERFGITKKTIEVNYYDDEEQKIRYIQFDYRLTDMTDVISAFASLDSSWTVFIISHEYWTPNASTPTVISQANTNFQNILNSTHNCTIGAFFVGHVHRDIDTTINGVPVIGTNCDAYGTALYGGTSMTLGTDTEQSFDIVQIDTVNRKIYCTRIGAGEDRTFTY